MTARPEVAVVIPTSGRETRLAFALEALAEQTLDRRRFEVIVVREPRPGPVAVAPPGLRVRFLSQTPGRGVGASRNPGWRATAAPLIAFTDDDCRPSPAWLEALLAAARGPTTFLQGTTEPDPDERHLWYGLARTQHIPGPSPWYQTCNMAYPRSLLERLEGFDERFDVMGEDADLALRAEEAGARRVFVPDALVWHAVHPRSLAATLRDTRKGRFLPLLLKRHPLQRRALYLHLFWNDAHGKLVLALVGAAFVRRLPGLAMLAAFPYLALRLVPRRSGVVAVARRIVGLPPLAVIDAVEVALTVRAAVRERVPVA